MPSEGITDPLDGDTTSSKSQQPPKFDPKHSCFRASVRPPMMMFVATLGDNVNKGGESALVAPHCSIFERFNSMVCRPQICQLRLRRGVNRLGTLKIGRAA